MAENVSLDFISLDFIAGQLLSVLEEQRAIRADLRRLTDNQAGLLRLIDKLSDRVSEIHEDLILAVKIEIGGLFSNLETRPENRIAAEIEARLGERGN